MVRECQGVVVDEATNWRIVSMPFMYIGSLWFEDWTSESKHRPESAKAQQRQRTAADSEEYVCTDLIQNWKAVNEIPFFLFPPPPNMYKTNQLLFCLVAGVS